MKKSNQNTSSSYNTLAKVVCRLTGFLIFTTMLSGVVMASSITHADTTVSSNASVIVNASCTITTGGGEYSETIDPGTSKTITGNGINVSCNDSGGYALYAIGFSGDSYDTPNNNRMLGPNSQYIPTANSGSNSYWAMKATGSSTTSNIPTIDNSYSNFQIIPATYTKISHYNSSTTGTTTNSVTTPSYKVNISSTQTQGAYVGKVKYTVVNPSTAPAPSNKTIATATTMQEVEVCPTSLAVGTSNTLTDTRDNSTYTVEKLADGNCWMTQNLRITGTVSSTGSNFSGSSFNVCAEDLANDSSYSVAECHNSNNTTTGVWYNYAAASAGTITGLVNTDEATSDICPFGWQMPTYSQISGVTSYKTTFNPVAGGRYHKKDNDDTSNGYWWSTTAYDRDSRYNLRYNNDELGVHHLLDRDDGFYIRCVKK